MGNRKSKKVDIKEDGLVLCIFYYAFYYAKKLSLFEWIRCIAKAFWSRKHDNREWERTKPVVFTYSFSDAWVLGNLGLSIAGVVLCSKYNNIAISWIFMIYAGLRMFEIFVYQVNVLLFDSIRAGKNYEIKSATRSVLLLVINMFEYIVWFATIYVAVERIFFRTEPLGITYFLQSLVIFTNLEVPASIIGEPNCGITNTVLTCAYIESLLGMFMNILCLARFVGMLPEVKSKSGN